MFKQHVKIYIVSLTLSIFFGALMVNAQSSDPAGCFSNGVCEGQENQLKCPDCQGRLESSVEKDVEHAPKLNATSLTVPSTPTPQPQTEDDFSYTPFIIAIVFVIILIIVGAVMFWPRKA